VFREGSKEKPGNKTKVGFSARDAHQKIFLTWNGLAVCSNQTSAKRKRVLPKKKKEKRKTRTRGGEEGVRERNYNSQPSGKWEEGRAFLKKKKKWPWREKKRTQGKEGGKKVVQPGEKSYGRARHANIPKNVRVGRAKMP